MSLPRAAAVLAAILVSLSSAGLVLAGSGSNDIVFSLIPGFPFPGRFTDPTGFACVNGNFPAHNPPASYERRCTPTFGATQCTSLEARGTLLGAFFPSAIEVNSSCSNAVDVPTFASCTANAPAYPGTCADGPSAAVVGPAFTFFCHVKPSGAAIFIGATCTAITT